MNHITYFEHRMSDRWLVYRNISNDKSRNIVLIAAIKCVLMLSFVYKKELVKSFICVRYIVNREQC